MRSQRHLIEFYGRDSTGYTLPPLFVGPVSGALSAMEAKDVAAIAAVLVRTGALAATETGDVAAIAGAIGRAGTLAATEVADIAALAASQGAAGTMAATGAADVANFATALATSGTLAATGAPDTAAITATGPAAAVTWNPADKEAGVTLSNGNLTATGTADGQEVRATQSRTPGGTSYYFEITVSAAGASLEAIGLANATFALTGFMGDNGSNSNGLYSNGYMLPSSDFAAAFAPGDVMGVELLASSAKWTKNGTLIYTLSSLPTGALFPMITVSTGGALIGNFGATAFAHLPSGSTAWDGTVTSGVTGTLAATGAPDTAAIAAAAAAPPTLVWDGDTTDATPDFEVTIDWAAVVVGTVITLRRADDVGFTTNVVDVTNTLDSGELGSASFNFVTGSLPNGTYYFKVFESVNNIDSNVETVTISATSWTTIADYQTATYTGVTPVCTRTGTAYATDNSGAYSSFGTDTLRRTNKGLLVEPAATNLLTYGLDPSDVTWGSWQVTSVTGGQTDPLGGTAAAQIVSSGGGGGRFGPAGEATYPAGTYTISGHFKRSSGSNDVRIETNSSYFSSGSHRSADFNLVTLATSVSGSGISNPQIEALANGWYRCSAQVVTEVSGSAPVTTFYSASAAGTFLGWHAQVEAGTKRTSPILVPGATQITRPADVVTLTVPSGKTQFRHTLSDGSVTTPESVTAGTTYTYPTAQAPLYIRKTEAS